MFACHRYCDKLWWRMSSSGPFATLCQIARGLQGPQAAVSRFAYVGLFVLLLSLVACGSDSDEAGSADGAGSAPTPGPQLTAQEYYDEVRAAFDRLEQAVAASARPPGQISDPQQILPVIQQAMTGLENAISPFVADIRALTPPDNIRAAHRDFVDALEKDQSAIASLAERVRASTNLSEAQAAFESRPNALAESRAPCEALEQLALGEGIAVDLPCQE